MKISLSIVKTNLIYGVLLLILMFAAACSSDSGGSSDAGAAPGPGPASSNITVAANPTSLTPNGTSVITATIRDSNGNLVPDGTTVTFSLSSVAYGSLSNTTVTTAAGIATTTFAAGTGSGSVTITATSGGNSNTVSLTVGTVSAGSIQFVSATPKVLGIKGAGQSETSVIQFLVIDVNGIPVNGALVNFVMTGPNGGEFIGDIDTTPNLASATTVSSGIASMLLHSGTIAGPVNITASTTIANGPIFSSATPLSIGGGFPSATHFSVGSTVLNLEGFDWINLQSIVNAFVADRFGNYNVLKGTSVSFYTEAGAIDRQGITGEDINSACHGPDTDRGCNAGAAGALFRTQDPMPQDVSPALAGDALSIYFGGNEYFRVDAAGITHNPRDGWVTIVVATKGEETFLDENHDGLFTRSYKSFDSELVRALGINLPRLRLLVFALGIALAAFAGIVMAPIWGIRPQVGVDAVVPAFLIIVLGGVGSFWGAVLAGLLVGIVVGLTGAFAGDWAIVSMYLLFIAVVTFRARGLFGRKSVLDV